MIANIIHNPARKDRLQNILEETAEQGIQYKLWPAVMDENPVRGCHLAHRAIVQWAKDTNQPAVWIMEDDCVFTAPNAALTFLHTRISYCIHTAAVYGVHKALNKHYEGWTYPTMSGTHCYIVDCRFYRLYLSMDTHNHLDVEIGKAVKYYQEKVKIDDCKGIIATAEITALQLPGHSDILNKEVDYNSDKFLQQPLFNTTLEEFNHKCKLKLERYANS